MFGMEGHLSQRAKSNAQPPAPQHHGGVMSRPHRAIHFIFTLPNLVAPEMEAGNCPLTATID
jgi:hypothetical protein